jgi:hypothetical protein
MALLFYVRAVTGEKKRMAGHGHRPAAGPSLSAVSRASPRSRSWLLLPALSADHNLVVYAFNAGTSPSQWEGFSLRWYALGLGRTSRSGCGDACILIVAALPP